MKYFIKHFLTCFSWTCISLSHGLSIFQFQKGKSAGVNALKVEPQAEMPKVGCSVLVTNVCDYNVLINVLVVNHRLSRKLKQKLRLLHLKAREKIHRLPKLQ